MRKSRASLTVALGLALLSAIATLGLETGTAATNQSPQPRLVVFEIFGRPG